MANTTARQYPYPLPGGDPDVPYWLQQLAEKVDTDVVRLLARENDARGLIGRNANGNVNNVTTPGSWTMFDLVAVPLVAGRWYEIHYAWGDSTASAGVANQPYAVVPRVSASNDASSTGTDIDNSATFWTAVQGASGNQQSMRWTWKAPTTGTFNIKMNLQKVVSTNQVNIDTRRLTVSDIGANIA